MHLFLKKIYRKNPFPKIYRINQCEVLNEVLCANAQLIFIGVYVVFHRMIILKIEEASIISINLFLRKNKLSPVSLNIMQR